MSIPVNHFSSFSRTLFDSDSEDDVVVRQPQQQQQVRSISRNIFSAGSDAGAPARLQMDSDSEDGSFLAVPQPQQQQVRSISRNIFSAGSDAGVPAELSMNSDSEDDSFLAVPQQQQQQQQTNSRKESFLSRFSGDIPSFKRSRTMGKQKSPYLALGKFTLNGTEYPVKFLGNGNFHKVFTFSSNEEVVLNGESFNTSNVVLKILGENVGPNKVNEVVQDEEKGYKYLQEAGFPVPKRFADPISFVDTTIPSNGNFWIIEKMPHAITGQGWSNSESFDELSHQDKTILSWAKSILTRMANEKFDLVNDFRKQNVMLNQMGEPVIIDFSMPDNEDFMMNLSSYVRDWANGNTSIKEYLTSDFPADIQI